MRLQIAVPRKIRVADDEARGCPVCNSVAELVGVEESLGRVLLDVVRTRIEANERILQQAVHQRELTLKAGVAASVRSLTAFLLGFNTLSKVIRDEDELKATCRSYLLGPGVPEAMLQ